MEEISENEYNSQLSIFSLSISVMALQYLVDQYQNSNKNCQMRKLKWTQQEEKYLKFLREQKSMKSWKEIAYEINRRFSQSVKSSKQCREKYINYSRFCGVPETENNQKWSESDDQKLLSLYNQFGSTWSFFTQSLVEKSENSIKNRFYNRLKKLAKKLDDHRFAHGQQIRGTTSYDSMIRILDFSNQVKALSIKNNVRVSPESALMRTREQILHSCFDHADEQNIACEDLCRLTKKMKEVNIKIRCFGICKAKNRKNWKLSRRGFDSTLLFDQFQTETVGIKVENSDQKQEPQAVITPSENEKEDLKYSTQNEQYFQYYLNYYYIPPYYMMPTQMAMYRPEYQQEYQIKLQQQIQNWGQNAGQNEGLNAFPGYMIKEQQQK